MHHISIYDAYMPHISRLKLNKQIEKELVEALTFTFTNLTKADDMQKFLTSLFSPTEELMLAKRFAIVVLLKEGFSQIEISRTLHVTRETVSRIALLQEIKGDGFNIALQKLDAQKKVQELKEVLIKLAGYSIRAAGGRVKPEIL